MRSDHHVTRLIVAYYHVRKGHSGTLHELSAIREKYWVIQGQATVRSVVRKCIVCRIQRAAPRRQFMAPLPQFRVTSGKPAFTWTGVDCMRPMLVEIGRSSEN